MVSSLYSHVLAYIWLYTTKLLNLILLSDITSNICIIYYTFLKIDVNRFILKVKSTDFL